MDKRHQRGLSSRQKKSIAIRIVLLFICVFILYGEYTRQKAEVNRNNAEENVQDSPPAAEEHKYPVYLVESMDNLHLDSEEFNIENYFIRNECQYSNRYYIDSDNVLWGYGGNEYG